MEKIPTIFDRDWQGNRGVVNTSRILISKEAIATEKLDGTNVRLTVRNNTLVRVEKRRNPDAIQKHKGIKEPWYVDAFEYEQSDKWVYDAAKNTDLPDVPDGEWSGEAVGPDVQGNPLNLDQNHVMLFSLGRYAVFGDCPTDFDGLKEWLPKQKSKYGKDCGIEGIVWLIDGKPIGKIKIKDFK